MSDIDLVTLETVRRWAEGILEEWLPGYTSPDPNQGARQYRIRQIREDGCYQVQAADRTGPVRTFRITINVEEMR